MNRMKMTAHAEERERKPKAEWEAEALGKT